MISKGRLIIISGPSGAGKSSLIKELLNKHQDEFVFSVSSTNRPQREGEIDGGDYFFISKNKFLEEIDKNMFLEWACVHGNYYGTSKEYVENVINNGKDCILDIDVQGATTLMGKKIEGIYIFIAPPSIEDLKKRLIGRGTDLLETIKKRIHNAQKELKYKDMYQHIIINKDFNKSLKRLEEIIVKKPNVQ